MKPLYLFGAGSQAKVLWEFLRDEFSLVAILNDFPAESPIPGVPVLEFDKASSQLDTSAHFAVSIGNHHGRPRVKKHEALISLGLSPVIARHPLAQTARGVSIGEGCQLLAMSFAAVDCHLGRQVILNTACSIDHECVLADGVHIGPGARVAGRVKIGAGSFLGTGAIVLPDLIIGEDCIIGAGAVVTKDIADGAVVAGNPARVIRRIR
ncbi:MAG: acetyltransferase [Armatimonadetes bacterium]|nr:acetyltransferase [Armatimonadota bacterium]